MIEDLKTQSDTLISHLQVENIHQRILTLRGHRVMLDSDLAVLYGVPTKVFNQAVQRNTDRFPEDFMFQLSRAEANSLRSQIVTLKTKRGKHRKYLPFAFTEQGVAMLSGVLRSQRAVQVNIALMHAFVQMRRMLVSHVDLARKIDTLERTYDAQFRVVFDAIRALFDGPPSENIRRLKEKKPFTDPFSFQEMKLLLEHVDPHYGAYFTTAFLTGMRPNEMIALKWSNVDFEMRCITVREGRVLGIEGPPKTMSSYRDIDMLEPIFEALRKHRQEDREGRRTFSRGKPAGRSKSTTFATGSGIPRLPRPDCAGARCTRRGTPSHRSC